MPITTSAKKALRGSMKKKAVNDRVTKVYKEATKAIVKLAKTNKTEAKALLSKAQSAIDKAMKKGVLKKNTASRKKALLSRITKS
ncbi:MAG: small subunit ribosomal protein [Bacteroidota bacterium]|nr:small subunit ribosomal protein [Bacteroidota bacterium]